MKIGLASVAITPQVRKNIQEALDEGMIAGGRFIKEFEEKFARYIGTRYAVFVSNGTVADALACTAVADGKRNEVIVPALTFVAQPNAIMHAGLKPVFVDVDERGQIEPTEVYSKINKNTLAIFATHLLGRVANVGALRVIADSMEIHLLEDCCEALGAKWHDERVGSYGSVGTFSFYASHHISTGEGGMCTTNDEGIYKKLISLRNHGRKGDNIEDVFTFEERGFNAKGTNLQAAIDSALIDNIDLVVEKRRENVERLGGWWVKELSAEYASPHCFPLFAKNRNEKIKELFEKGIEVRKLMACIPNQKQCPAYKFMGHKDKEFPMAEKLGETGLFIPCHQLLSPQELDEITYVLQSSRKT